MATPKSVFDACPVKFILTADLQNIHVRIFQLYVREMHAVINRDYDMLLSVGDELVKAHNERNAAIETIRSHLSEHDC